VAVKIKLQRLGQIRQPHYRVIVADARTRRSGRAIENIGKYHPKQEPSFIEIDSERVQHWLSVGAQPTEPVQRLLEITGDWQKFKGLPGAEGTLKVAAPKTSKQELFEAALAAAGDQPVTEATTPKKRSSKKAADKPAADKPADGDAKADAKPAAKAAGKEAKAEAKADTKTEAKADEATDKAASEGA
jgi:small subunit ribosomal protein S16